MDLKIKRGAQTPHTIKERNFLLGEIFDDSLMYMRSGLSEPGILAARGILICLVVIGHIRSDGGAFFYLKAFIYDFHIMAFLMISMLRPVPNLSLHSIKVVTFRYLKILIPVSLLAFLIFNFGILGLNAVDVIQRVPVYITALVGGNYASFDFSTGLELFWYMYALIGLICLRMMVKSLPSKRYAVPAFLVACLAIGSICSIYFPTISPSWFGIATYALPVLFLAICLLEAISRLERINEPLFFSLFIIILLVIGAAWVPGNSYNIAWLRIPLPWDLPNFLVWLAFLALAFKALIKVCNFKISQIVFLKIGRLSLGIYLTHMFFLFPIDLFLMDQVEWDPIRIVLTFACTIAVSAFAASMLNRS
jgi:fucose 4-O-acetylase-like acetyltransferase